MKRKNSRTGTRIVFIVLAIILGLFLFGSLFRRSSRNNRESRNEYSRHRSRECDERESFCESEDDSNCESENSAESVRYRRRRRKVENDTHNRRSRTENDTDNNRHRNHKRDEDHSDDNDRSYHAAAYRSLFSTNTRA